MIGFNKILKESELGKAVWNGGDLLYSYILEKVRLNSILKGRLKTIHLERTEEEEDFEFNNIENLILKNNQVYVSFKDGTNYVLSEDLQILSKFRLGIILDVTDSDVPFYFTKKNKTEYLFYLGQDFIVQINKDFLSSRDLPIALLTTSTSGAILLKKGLLVFDLNPEVITNFIPIDFIDNESWPDDRMFLIQDRLYVVHRNSNPQADKTYIYEVDLNSKEVTSYIVYHHSRLFSATNRYIILFDFLPNVAYVWDTVIKKEIPIELYSKNYVDETKAKIIPSLNNYFPKELSKEITSYIYYPKYLKPSVESFQKVNRSYRGQFVGRTLLYNPYPF